MVPFALNTNRVPENEGGKFFKAVLRKQDWPQGLWVVSPEGKVLAFHYYRNKPGEKPAEGQARWIKETRAAIDDGLKAFGEVKPRDPKKTDPLKNRGVGTLSSGGVRLAIYAHGMFKGKKDGEPVVDSAILTASEWAAFTPPALTPGTTWSLPAASVSKLAPVLSPMTDAIFTPQPKDATFTELTGKIESVNDLGALVRFTGKLETQHNRDGDPKFPIHAGAAIEGYAIYAAPGQPPKALLLVTKGEYRRSATPQATAGVIDWHAE